MKICDPHLCTGCGSCANACPVDCITMVNDNNGFIVPQINEKTCVQCKKCFSSCPVNKSIALERMKEPSTFAAYISDKEQIQKSSSGGIFAILAKNILKEGGIVYGVWLTDQHQAVFGRAETIEELSKMQGSKYVQSRTGMIYRDVLATLKEGRKVLFSGLPCQIGGLYTFLGSDYPNLYTVDVICYGETSETVMKEYLAYQEEKHCSIVSKVVLRYRTEKWRPMNYGTKLHLEFEDGNQYNCALRYDPYGIIMMQGLAYADSCYQCYFNGFPRVADITLGDALGLGTIEKTGMYCSDGISSVFLNSIKGRNLYQRCRNELTEEKRSLYEPCCINMALWTSVKYNANKEPFLLELAENGFESALNKYINNPKSRLLLFMKRMTISILGEKNTLRLMHIVRLLRKKYPAQWPDNRYTTHKCQDMD